MSEPRAIDLLLARYGQSHRHRTNELIHFICIPAIMFSLLGLIWSAHPMAAVGTALLVLAYYITLSIPFALGMVLVGSGMLAILAALPPPAILPLSALLFALSWLGQFLGHKIERNRPAFRDDLRFLLIGPLFVLGFLYRRLRLAY